MTTGAVRRTAAVVLVVAGTLVAAWGVRQEVGTDPTPAVTPAVTPTATPGVPAGSPTRSAAEPGTPPPTRTTPTAPGPRRHPAAGVPQRVAVPALDIDAPVVGIDVVDGVLTPPSDAQVLGWWDAGAAPGAARGAALVTGHTVSVGGGALDDLERLRPGDPVRVTTGAGTIRYGVTDVRIYRKATLAEHAERLFSQTAPGHLLLVTCEDWDGTRYNSNVVVRAVPLPA